MAPINLALAAVKRTGFPYIPTVNCLVEKNAGEPGAPAALVARGGLEAFKAVGTAPIRCFFQRQGLFSDKSLVVALDTVYLMSRSGNLEEVPGQTIEGDDLLEVDAGLDADYNSVARFATGSALYKLEGSFVTQEDFPTSGGAGATSVAFFRGYWLASEAGSDAVYYQVPAATTWNALQFASAEYAPDKIVCLRVVGDMVALLGESTTEFWYATGNSSSPLEPVAGLKFDFGCRAKAAAVNCQGALAWVDSDCNVRLFTGGEPRIISDSGLAEQIRKTPAADIRASYGYIADGHPCYVLSLGSTATWAYDLANPGWVLLRSLDRDYWRPQLLTNVAGDMFASDAESNQVWRLDFDRQYDGTDVFTMEFVAVLPAEDSPIPISNIELLADVGDAPADGEGSEPLVGMQKSDDRGKSYGGLRFRNLGLRGKTQTRVRWAALGYARNPFGAMFKFQVSDPVVRRVYGVRANTQ